MAIKKFRHDCYNGYIALKGLAIKF